MYIYVNMYIQELAEGRATLAAQQLDDANHQALALNTQIQTLQTRAEEVNESWHTYE